MKYIGAILVLLGLSACAPQSPRPASEPSPFVYNEQSLDGAQSIVFLLPGALTPLEIFAPVQAWDNSDYAVVGYRYPGMDDASLRYDLILDQAADDLVTFAEQHPDKKIRILAYSTGAPIAFMAASRMKHANVIVAALAPAVERAGGVSTAFNGIKDITAAAIRARSLKLEAIWPEYYKTLLFGSAAHSDDALRARAKVLLAQEKDRIVLPDTEINRAQTRDLKSWTVPEGLALDPEAVRLFIGLNDPVFTTRQTRKLARKLGLTSVVGYRDNGHLLFISRPDVFDDVRAFLEE